MDEKNSVNALMATDELLSTQIQPMKAVSLVRMFLAYIHDWSLC